MKTKMEELEERIRAQAMSIIDEIIGFYGGLSKEERDRIVLSYRCGDDMIVYFTTAVGENKKASITIEGHHNDGTKSVPAEPVYEYKRAKITEDGWYGGPVLRYDGFFVSLQTNEPGMSILRQMAQQLNDCIKYKERLDALEKGESNG